MKKCMSLFTIFAIILMLSACGENKAQTETTSMESVDMSAEIVKESQNNIKDTETAENEEHDIASDSNEYKVDWSDISNGELNEESFLQKLDADTLKEVAAELQALVDEEIAEEKENPDIIVTEGFARVFRKEQYLRVLDMGKSAEMPLYYILYKSKYDGMYEYICANALSELTGVEFMNKLGDYREWSTGKEYLKLFNEYMGHDKGKEK